MFRRFVRQLVHCVARLVFLVCLVFGDPAIAVRRVSGRRKLDTFVLQPFEDPQRDLLIEGGESTW